MEEQTKENHTQKNSSGNWLGTAVVVVFVVGLIAALVYFTRKKPKEEAEEGAAAEEDRRDLAGFPAQEVSQAQMRSGNKQDRAEIEREERLRQAEIQREKDEAEAELEKEINSIQIVRGLVSLDSDRIVQQPKSTGYDVHTRAYRPARVRGLDELKLIVVHHSHYLKQEPSIEYVNSWWLAENRTDATEDWDRAGYHFLIRGDGKIWQLVPITAASWGAGRYINEQAIHVAFAGRFTPENLPTQEARQSFSVLCNALLRYPRLTYINDRKAHVQGHRRVKGARTVCPGFSEDQYLSWI